MLIAALLQLYGRANPLKAPAAAFEMEPHTELVLITTLVFFFFSSGRKCLVTKKGPTTFTCSTLVYSSPVLQRFKIF